MTSKEHRAISAAVEGTSHADFRPSDWGHLGVVALIFGSGFLFISVALRSLSPGVVSFGKAGLGAAAMVLIPAARKHIGRADWSRLVVAAALGMSLPTILVPLAQERVPSALAGMLVSSIPIFTAVVAAIETRKVPRRSRLVGLLVGFVGIVLLSAPNLTSLDAQALGVALILIAMAGHAVATTIYAPLQQSYGALPVAFWLVMVSAIFMAPFGIAGLANSSVELKPILSLILLGTIGTGLVWAIYLGFIGRVGAVRASIVGYMIPIIALILGVVVLDEQIEIIQVAGVLTALIGGYLLSKGDAPGSDATQTPVTPETHHEVVHIDPSCATRQWPLIEA
jgi:drug/metabolite transporter (DMT)-like permease